MAPWGGRPDSGVPSGPFSRTTAPAREGSSHSGGERCRFGIDARMEQLALEMAAWRSEATAIDGRRLEARPAEL